MSKKDKETVEGGKKNSPSFFIGGIGCLVLAWLIICLIYSLWAGFDEPGKLASLWQGLTWQASDTTTDTFRITFYILGAATLAFTSGLTLMAIMNRLPKAVVRVKMGLALLLILVLPFVQLGLRLGIPPRWSFPLILLTDTILAVSFLVSFTTFLSVRRHHRKKKAAAAEKG